MNKKISQFMYINIFVAVAFVVVVVVVVTMPFYSCSYVIVDAQ